MLIVAARGLGGQRVHSTKTCNMDVILLLGLCLVLPQVMGKLGPGAACSGDRALRRIICRGQRSGTLQGRWKGKRPPGAEIGLELAWGRGAGEHGRQSKGGAATGYGEVSCLTASCQAAGA